MISFIVNSIPVAQPRQRHRAIEKKDGKTSVMNYTPTKHPVNAFKAAVQLALSQAYQGPVIEGPIWMDVISVFPRPANMIWKTKDMPRVPMAKKPDRDNTVKAVQDALEGLLYRNDSQVFDGRIGKYIAAGNEQPHVEIIILTEGEFKGH